MAYQTIKAAELFQSDQIRTSILLDVRTPAEFRQSHVPESVSMPLNTLDPTEVATLLKSKDSDAVYVICQSGQRAAKAADMLVTELDSPVSVVEGGMNEIEKLNIELTGESDKSVISIERQTRIAAGTLMLVGVLGSLWIHPGFLWLSGFVGAGLIFAGVTNTCGMGMLLARMPWNR